MRNRFHSWAEIFRTRLIHFEFFTQILRDDYEKWLCRIMRECVYYPQTKNDLTEAMLQQSTAFLLHASFIVYDHELLSSESMV